MNKTNPHKKSFILFLGLTLLALLFILAFNRLIDPQSYFSSPKIEGLNLYKPEIHSERAILHSKPKVIILGSSRAEVGLDPLDPSWNQSSVFNLASGGTNIFDSYHYLKHANQHSKVETVYLMVDFFMFNDSRKPYFEQDYDFLDSIQLNEPFFNSKTISSLISFQTLKDSFITLSNQNPASSAQTKYGGRFDITPSTYSKLKSVEGSFFKVHYRNFSHQNMLQGFEKIVDFAYLNNIELVIGISPMHSRLLEVVVVSDIWDEFEDWKKRLSKILDSQSKQHLKPNFLLFDFADYNKFSTEEAPSKKNHREMRWFIESSHYNYKLGSLVIQRMSNKNIETTEFGNIIDVNNIDAHLRNVRLRQKSWGKEYQWHKNDVQSIQR
jgi:hypothetical protein